MRQVYRVYLLLYYVNQFREYFFVCIRMTRNEKKIYILALVIILHRVQMIRLWCAIEWIASFVSSQCDSWNQNWSNDFHMILNNKWFWKKFYIEEYWL